MMKEKLERETKQKEENTDSQQNILAEPHDAADVDGQNEHSYPLNTSNSSNVNN